MKKIILVFFILITINFFGIFFYFNHWLNQPIFETNKIVQHYVKKGASFVKITHDLENKNIIKYPRIFILYSNMFDNINKVKYGTYEFNEQDTPKTVLMKLIQGKTVVIKVTIPEGLNIYQIAQRLENYFPKILQQEWLKYFSNENFIQSVEQKMNEQNTNMKSIEGFLFPQTYFFDPNQEPELIVKTFLQEFNKFVTSQMFAQARYMGLTPIQFVTLASIIEKETGLKSERNLVASVYWNRIKKGMRLQADPTVIYGMWKNYKGVLKKSDLQIQTPYNTYTNLGLPVGPISCPGIDSILATLNPAQTNYLYFVANGTGGHTFSKNLKEHNRAVEHYIQFLKKSKM